MREAVDGLGDFAEDLLDGGAGLDFGNHALAGLLLDFGKLADHFAALGGIGDIAGDGRREHGGQVLRGVGQGGVGADRDALHALGAVFGNVERGFAAGDVLGGGVAGGRGDDAHGAEGGGGLVVAEAGAEFGVEGGDGGDGRAGRLTLGGWGRAAAAGGAGGPGAAFGSVGGDFFEDGQEGLAAEGGAIGRRDIANGDLLDALPALEHDFHVGLNYGVALLAEFLDVLLVNDFLELVLGDAELVEQAGAGEEGAEEGVALHAELKVAAVGGLAGDVEAGQGEDPDVLLDDLLASPDGEVLPGALAFLVGLPDEAAALLHAVKGVAVGEGFGIAAENRGDVAQVAVDANALFGGDHEVAGGGAFLLGTILRVGADVDDFLGIAQFVGQAVALEEQVVEITEDGAEVFAGGDGAPSADGVEADGDGFFGEQGGCLVADDGVGVVDAEDDEVFAVGKGLAVFAGAAGGGVLVSAEDVLRAEVARAEAVGTGDDLGNFFEGELGETGGSLDGLGDRGADVFAEGVVGREGFVGALEDDDVFLAANRFHDGCLGEGADDVDMDGADAGITGLPEVVDGGLDVFCGGTEGDEDGVGVLGFVLGDQAVIAAGEVAEVLVGGFEEIQDGLGEVVAPRHHAVHVVFLVLDRAEEDGVGEVHHLGDAAAGGSEEDALGLGGAVDDVVGSAEVLADQLGLVLIEGALEVRGEEPVHDIHAGGQRKLGDAAKDEGLVGGLLGVLAEDHDPAGVEGAVDVVVSAVDVEGVLGKGAGADLEHHGGTLAGGMVILLDAIDDTLAGGEVDHALAADGVSDGAALGSVLAFGLDGDGIVAEHVQMTLSVGLLEELATFSGGGDGVEHAGVGDARLGVVGDELVSVGGDPDSGIAS